MIQFYQSISIRELDLIQCQFIGRIIFPNVASLRIITPSTCITDLNEYDLPDIQTLAIFTTFYFETNYLRSLHFMQSDCVFNIDKLEWEAAFYSMNISEVTVPPRLLKNLKSLGLTFKKNDAKNYVNFMNTADNLERLCLAVDDFDFSVSHLDLIQAMANVKNLRKIELYRFCFLRADTGVSNNFINCLFYLVQESKSLEEIEVNCIERDSFYHFEKDTFDRILQICKKNGKKLKISFVFIDNRLRESCVLRTFGISKQFLDKCGEHLKIEVKFVDNKEFFVIR